MQKRRVHKDIGNPVNQITRVTFDLFGVEDGNVEDIFGFASKLCYSLSRGIACLRIPPSNSASSSCPTIFEFSHCWTETPYGERLETNCPVLSAFSRSDETTYRDCAPAGYFLNGTANSELPAGWHSMSETFNNYLMQNCSGYGVFNVSEDYQSNDTIYDDYDDYSSEETYTPENMRLLTLILKLLLTFSCLSFICILVSLLLMSTFLRKCTRVYIHMNLLFAFMFRSFLFIWSQVTFIWKTPRMEEKYNYLPNLIDDLAPYEIQKFEQEDLSRMEEHYDDYCIAHMENEKTFLFLCQLYPALQNYSVLACFGWLTCEGLYLVLLQKLPSILFKKFNPMHLFILLGWGFPGAVVGFWAYLMYTRPEGSLQCFSGTQYDKIFNYVINSFVFTGLIIFIILIVDIIKKLRAPRHIAGSGNFTIRMSKATISMIPLLGGQYVIVPFLTEENGVPPEIAKVAIWLSTLFSSSHGIIVSFLYCFTSTEMINAVSRQWKVHKEIQSVYKEISSRRQSRDTFTTHLKVSRDDDIFSAQRQHSATPQKFGKKDEFDSENSPGKALWEKERVSGSLGGSRTNCSDFSDSGFSDEKNVQVDLLDDF